MAENKNKVYVELYDAPMTERKDDRIGRVLSNGSATVDDLIADAVERGTDISPITLRASYDLLKTSALNRVLRMQRVAFGLGIIYTEPTGSFIGDAAKWDPAKNRLIGKLLPSKELRDALKNSDVEVLGMAKVPNMISSIEDVVTGEVNVCLTRGGMVHIHGNKIKIAGSDSTVGLKLTSSKTGAVVDIPTTAIGINNPSRISFVVPADLTPDEYTLSIVTRYSGGGTELKNPRTVTPDYSLTVD
jgi:hypothetical protein